MNKTDLKKLKDQLPRNYAKILMQKTGKSYSSVFKTFHEGSDLIVYEVVDAAIELAEATKVKNNERNQRIAQLS